MIFLSYLWSGWRIEFRENKIHFTNPANFDVYEITLDPYESPPFHIILLKRG